MELGVGVKDKFLGRRMIVTEDSNFIFIDVGNKAKEFVNREVRHYVLNWTKSGLSGGGDSGWSGV